MTPPQLKLFITNWIWALHNEVNADNNKPAYDFSLLNVYDSVNFQDQLWRLDPVIKRAIQLSGVSLLKWTAWIHSYKMLLSLVS